MIKFEFNPEDGQMVWMTAITALLVVVACMVRINAAKAE